MKLRFRSARRLLVFLQVIASLVTIPWVIMLFVLFFTPARDWTPSDTFHSLRRFFFRILAGRTLRPLILRTSLPAGTSIRSSSNTTTQP